MHTALLWDVEGDRVRCHLCPNNCLISRGGVGVCGVRSVGDDGNLHAMTYGKISSIAADPIEKKPVFHYFPGTSILSLGSVGCSMRCGHCQNWSISRASPGDDCMHRLEPAAVVDMARTYRCPGVAFTYNEPVIWAEYVLDVSRLCREAGLFTVMVTNGYITNAGLDLLGEVIDVWRVDLKGSRDETYRKLCHVPAVQPVMDAAVRARHTWGMHVEVVTNLVPTINDSAEEITEMATFIAESLGTDTPWHITRFFPYLDFAHLEPTPLGTLKLAREAGKAAGLRFVYLGNIDEPGGEDTVCPVCGAVAIRRSGYTILEKATRQGACARCATPLNLVE